MNGFPKFKQNTRHPSFHVNTHDSLTKYPLNLKPGVCLFFLPHIHKLFQPQEKCFFRGKKIENDEATLIWSNTKLNKTIKRFAFVS